MNFDEIIGGGSNNKPSPQNQPFNKEEWVKKKQEEKSKAYEMIDKAAKEIIESPEKFKQYLDIQARFDKYSIGNALLIVEQMPTAKQIKDYDSWKEAGAYINKNAKAITILEPGDSYTKADGTTSVSFNPKKVFDISQTNAKQNEKNNQYDDKIMLKAFLHECPVDIKAVDELSDINKGAEWNKEDNVLYIRRGLESPIIFNVVATELAKVGLETTGNQEMDNFKSYCASYLVCRKHNIDVSSFNFDNLPETLKNMNTADIRNTLGDIRGTMEDINSRMSNYFESISKSSKNKDLAR